MDDMQLRRLKVILAEINQTDDDQRQLAAIRLLPSEQREDALQLMLAVLRKRIEDHVSEVRALLEDKPSAINLFDQLLSDFQRSVARYRQ